VHDKRKKNAVLSWEKPERQRHADVMVLSFCGTLKFCERAVKDNPDVARFLVIRGCLGHGAHNLMPRSQNIARFKPVTPSKQDNSPCSMRTGQMSFECLLGLFCMVVEAGFQQLRVFFSLEPFSDGSLCLSEPVATIARRKYCMYPNDLMTICVGLAGMTMSLKSTLLLGHCLDVDSLCWY
jgi:hypothetical protein